MSTYTNGYVRAGTNGAHTTVTGQVSTYCSVTLHGTNGVECDFTPHLQVSHGHGLY